MSALDSIAIVIRETFATGEFGYEVVNRTGSFPLILRLEISVLLKWAKSVCVVTPTLLQQLLEHGSSDVSLAEFLWAVDGGACRVCVDCVCTCMMGCIVSDQPMD